MEIQVQAQQVVKDVAGHLPDRLLRDIGKHGISELLEHRRSYPREAILRLKNHYFKLCGTRGEIEARTCYYDGASGGPHGAAEGEEVDVHGVYDGLEEEGHLDVEDLTGISIAVPRSPPTPLLFYSPLCSTQVQVAIETYLCAHQQSQR